MENSNQQVPPVYTEPEQPSFFERMSNSIVLKLVTMLILVLFLLIPMDWVNSLISERKERERSVSAEIASKWGSSQVISGPIIGIPYIFQYTVKTTDEKGKPKLETYSEEQYVFLTAKRSEFTSVVNPEYLKRGIYQSVVYNATVTTKGEFEEIDFSKLTVKPEDLKWEDAKLFIGLSDLKGLKATPDLDWGGKKAAFQVSNGDVALFERTMAANIDLSSRSTKGKFSIALDVRGSRTLTVFPSAEETAVKVSGKWANPSFNGGFLPEKRQTENETFSASWRIPSFSRKFPQQWAGASKTLYKVLETEDVTYTDDATDIPEPAVKAAENGMYVKTSTEQDMVQVNFLESVNNYQKTSRVAKYGVLVILLTFTALFFTEIIKKKRVHIVQYILIGCAMVLFYSLLLAIGEHIGFNWAYLLSAIATTVLIASFVYGITKVPKIGYVFSSILGVFYAFIYLLMQLQDFSLIVGTVGMFIILAVLMRLSTRINWFQFERKN